MYTDFLGKIKVIDDSFFSKEECIDIKNKLLAIKKDWKEVKGIDYFKFYPIGMYATRSLESYKTTVNNYRLSMYDQFGSYYEKILNELQKICVIPISYNKNVNYPGFHIGTGTLKVPNYHKDNFEFLNSLLGNDFANSTILSVIVPISVKTDTGLLINHNKHISRHTSIFDEELLYKEGMLAIWDGSIFHSVKPFKSTDENDLRITFQCHIAISNNKGYIFW